MARHASSMEILNKENSCLQEIRARNALLCCVHPKQCNNKNEQFAVAINKLNLDKCFGSTTGWYTTLTYYNQNINHNKMTSLKNATVLR